MPAAKSSPKSYLDTFPDTVRGWLSEAIRQAGLNSPMTRKRLPSCLGSGDTSCGMRDCVARLPQAPSSVDGSGICGGPG